MYLFFKTFQDLLKSILASLKKLIEKPCKNFSISIFQHINNIIIVIPYPTENILVPLEFPPNV